jgi:hypothetical protein
MMKEKETGVWKHGYTDYSNMLPILPPVPFMPQKVVLK